MRNPIKLIFSLNFLYIVLIAAQVAAIIFLCLYIPSYFPLALAFAIAWLTAAITACVLFARKGNAEVKCAWFVLIAALPVAGAFIYLIATGKKTNCGALEITGADGNGLCRAANILCGTCEAGYDGAEYFSGGAEFFDSMIRDIESAKKCVYIEFFIIGRGKIFEKTLAALKAAKARGAEIKLIYDGVGSAFKIGRKEIKKLKSIGAEIKIFHRLSPLPRAKLNFRDHRKIVVIDGKTAYFGGINLADEYANIDSPYGYWKDSGVKLFGGAAKIFEGMFLAVWNHSHKMSAPEGGKFKCMPFYDSPPTRGFAEDAFVCAVNGAKTRVHIMTPYLCMSEKLASAVRFACMRGVDVKIIIPHIPDKKYAFEITLANAAEMIACGAQIYQFTPGFMHAKCIICDDTVFLGSYNFDYRSTHYNFECGAIFYGEMTEAAEKDFTECAALSSPITKIKCTPLKRVYRFFLKLFAPLI